MREWSSSAFAVEITSPSRLSTCKATRVGSVQLDCKILRCPEGGELIHTAAVPMENPYCSCELSQDITSQNSGAEKIPPPR